MSLGFNNPHTPEELADIFRSAKVLYCYEVSAIMIEAMLCGCPAVYVKTPVLEPFLNDLSDTLITPYFFIVDEESIDCSQEFTYDVAAFNRDYRLEEAESVHTVARFISRNKAGMDYYLAHGDVEGFEAGI